MSAKFIFKIDKVKVTVAIKVVIFYRGERFCANFVWKFALQRVERKKREGMQISKQST